MIMKKLTLLVAALAIAMALASCGGAKSDAKKICKKACQCKELKDKDQDKFMTCINEYMEMALTMADKYANDEKADATLTKVTEECGCMEGLLF